MQRFSSAFGERNSNNIGDEEECLPFNMNLLLRRVLVIN